MSVYKYHEGGDFVLFLTICHVPIMLSATQGGERYLLNKRMEENTFKSLVTCQIETETETKEFWYKERGNDVQYHMKKGKKIQKLAN